MNTHVFTTYPSGFVNTSGFIPVASTVDEDGKPINARASRAPKKE